MSGVPRLRAAVAVAALTILSVPAVASASYGDAAEDSDGAQLVSADYERLEQGDDGTVFAAISSDGRYVAIQTRARNFFADNDADPPGRYRAGGVFRFDLQTKKLEKVADGDLFDEATNEFLRRGASNPSISANGRYVAFATAQPVIPADTNQNVDIYVRDMDRPASDPAAFDLVSARDGSDTPATYGPPSFPFPGSEPGGEISRGVGISADGQKVVFRTDAPTDLPASGAVDVPAGQVFVRDRSTDTTTLVTAKRDAGTGEMTEEPAGGAVNAAISADGTTVAWTGSRAASQTRFLGGENQEPSFLYYLWRRISDGPTAQTRRITGLADPDDPACPPSAESTFDQTATGPCFGPLTDQEANRSSISPQLPALSGDGYTVAFLTGSGPRPLAFTGTGLDLYVTDMTPGLSRKEATVELTRDPSDFNPATSSPLSSIAMSAGGRYLAMATVRTDFTLPALQFVGESRSITGPRELYMVDLDSRTIERVTHSYTGGDIDSDVQNGISVTTDGGAVAFTSFAGNLFFGDANQRTDAFVATRRPDPEDGLGGDGPGDSGPSGTIETDAGGPTIAARAKSKPGGVVVITVSVPGAGGVKVVAKGRAGAPPKQRVLATATARAAGTIRTEVKLELRPVVRYRAELRERKTITGRALVSYVASRGGRHANTSLPVTFAQAPGPKKSSHRGRK